MSRPWILDVLSIDVFQNTGTLIKTYLNFDICGNEDILEF